MKKEKSCGAIVFRYNNTEPEFLLIQHRAGHWGFPKGHTEKGEKEIMTALREVAEETGLTVEIQPNFRHRIEYRPFNKKVLKEVIYFLGKFTQGIAKPQESELKTLGWFSFSQALSQLTFNNDRFLLHSAGRYLKKYQTES